MSDCKDELLKHELDCSEKNGKRFNNLETDIKLSNQNFKYMQKELTEIKDLVKSGFENVYVKIDEIDEKYATKEELQKTNSTMGVIIKMGITAGLGLIGTLTKLIYDFIVR